MHVVMYAKLMMFAEQGGWPLYVRPMCQKTRWIWLPFISRIVCACHTIVVCATYGVAGWGFRDAVTVFNINVSTYTRTVAMFMNELQHATLVFVLPP